MADDKGKKTSVHRASLSAAEAAGQLGVSEDRLGVYALQGRPWRSEARKRTSATPSRACCG
jgi:hypothetical protein